MTTQRTANVVLANHTHHKFTDAMVTHRYSDDNPEFGSWKNVDIHQTTTSFAVNYRTGAFTTGQDWWIVTWTDDKGRHWVTSPRNARGFVDWIETTWLKYLQGKENQPLPGYLNPERHGEMTQQLERFKATVGFKSFILREKDEHATVTITVVEEPNDHFTVTYSAPSGDDHGNPVKQVS